MTPRDDLNAKTETAHRLLARCRTEGRQLLERASIPAGPDGYPRTASGADPTATVQPLYGPESDEESGRAISYSDPTGDAAGGHTGPDPVKRAGNKFWGHVLKAVDHLEQAGAILDYQQYLIGQATPAGDEDRWCQSCARDHGYREPVRLGRYAKYCGWCGPFVAAHHQEPPMELLEKRHSGQTIYDRDITRALAGKRRKAG